MKNLTILIFLFIAICCKAQDVDKLPSVVYTSLDSTFRVKITQSVDGLPVSSRYIPENSTLSKTAFIDLLYQYAKEATARAVELQRLRKEALDEITFFSSKIDSIQGAGTYQARVNAELQATLQGQWKLIEKLADGTINRFKVTITGLVAANNDNTGTVTIIDGSNANIIIPNVIGGTGVNFEARNNGTFVGAKATRKYTLKR